MIPQRVELGPTFLLPTAILCVNYTKLKFLHTAILVGGFNLSEKYESQLGLLFPIYGK